MTTLLRMLMLFALVLLAVPAVADIAGAKATLERSLSKLEEYGFRVTEAGQGASWWAWNMNPGYYHQVDRTFYRNVDYALVTGGDSRVNDVDLRVYDENWNLIGEDTDSSSVAIVRFTPKWTGLFHVRVTYYAGAQTGSVGFFIAVKQ
jgi:hypothetical protein